MRKILLGCFLLCFSALGMDVSGRWWGEAVTDGQTHPIYVMFIQQGEILKGTGGPGPMEQSPMEAGRVAGNRIIFDISPGARAPLHFELTLDGEVLRGTMSVKHNGQTVSGKVSLRRRTN